MLNKNITRPSESLIKAYNGIASATIHEAMGRKGAIDSRIKPIYNGMKVCGSALTCKCQVGDNLTLHAAIHIAQPGDVIIASVGQYTEQGLFGDLMATSAKAKGVKGLVLDGCVRDGETLKKMGFSVFAYGLCIKGTVKETIGSLNNPIVMGDELINPGDIIVGDDDGVVVIPLEKAEAVLDLCKKRDEKEEALRNQFADGKSTWDVFGLNAILESKGNLPTL